MYTNNTYSVFLKCRRCGSHSQLLNKQLVCDVCQVLIDSDKRVVAIDDGKQ